MSIYKDLESEQRDRESFEAHFAPIAHLLASDDITDIMLNTPRVKGEPGEVWIDKQCEGLVDSGVRLSADEALAIVYDVVSTAEGHGQDVVINSGKPVVSCQAAGGQFRFEATVPPASFAPSFVIRLYIQRPDIQLVDYVKAGEMSPAQAEALQTASRSGTTVLLGGETGSGKTTLLMPMIAEVANGGRRRIVLIEDTPELVLPAGPHTRLKVSSSAGSAFTYRDAVISALRQRPNVVVLGELRHAADANEAITAWSTGHQGLATLHAGSCREMLWRLHGLCRQSETGRHMQERTIASTIGVCVHLRRQNGRRVIDMQRVLGWDGNDYVLEAL